MSQPLLRFHEWHTSDPVAMEAYRAAIIKLVQPGDIFLDIGAGTGILSFFACAAGAARVYAVEPSDIANVIERMAAANGIADRVIIRKGLSWDVEIPEKADVIVTSMLDSFGVNNNLLEVVIDARRRLLKPGGSLIPSRVRMSFAPVELADWYKENIDCWTEPRFGFDCTPARAIAVNQFAGTAVARENLLASPGSFGELDLLRVESPSVFAQTDFVVQRPGVFHGLAGWFEAEMAPGVLCSNSPFDPRRLPWNNAIFAAGRGVPVEAGDKIEASIRGASIGGEIVWVWAATVIGSAGVTRNSFRQSTFHGALIVRESMAELAKTR